MIYSVVPDSKTGEISKGSNDKVNVRFTHTYLVITDNSDSAYDLYTGLISNYNSTQTSQDKKLPVYGDILGEIPVNSIRIDKWDESNMKAVPSFGLPVKDGGSYTAWKYEVEYSEETDSSSDGGSSSSDEKAPWKSDIALNCSLTPKEYQWYTNTHYNGLKAPYKKVILENAVGDPIYRNIILRNYVLSFDYAVKKFPVTYAPVYTNTLNHSKLTIAGLDIPAGGALITSLVPSMQTFKKETYVNVHAEIELAWDKTLQYELILGTGYRARPQDKETGLAYPIQEFTGTATEFSSISSSDVTWLDKDNGLGSFSSKLAGKYQNVSEPKVLDKYGRIYTKKLMGTEQVDLLDKNLNIVKAYDHKVKDWSALGFPKKGFNAK